VAGQLEPAAMLDDDGSLASEGQTQFANNCSRCHQVNGLENAEGEPIVAAPEQNVYSGAAPNLTHLMSRTTFAGGMFELQKAACYENLINLPPDEIGQEYLKGTTAECLNAVRLRAWLRNAPAEKPMGVSEQDLAATDGLYRGMPYLGLSEDQIDQLVAYLLTLK
jgi:cytochrome c oxidase subunit 2